MRSILARALSIGCASIGAAALAQPDPRSGEDVEQIIVTGARAPLPVDQLGSATTIITRDQLEARQARYVVDVLRAVPGFSFSQTGGIGSQTQIRVRGAEANHVLVLIDGVRANDPATGDEFRWEYLSSANVERIEIVRGAQSSLWGSDAVSAVVHIVTRTGGGTRADGFAERGADDTRNVGITGNVDQAGWSLGGGIDYLDTSGHNVSRFGSERDGADLLTAMLSARLAASDALTLDANLRLADGTSQYDPVDFFTTGLPIDGDVATDSTNLFGRIGAEWQGRNARASHRFSASYYDSEHENFTAGLYTSSAAADRAAFAWQSDIRLGENLVSVALEREHTSFRQRGEVGFGDPNQDQSMAVTSAVAELQWLAGERLTWLAGARFDDNTDFEDAATARVSIAYRLSEIARLRTSLGTARKNPTFTERFGFFPDQFIGNPNLKPEESTSFDVGIDWTLRDGALELQASLFRQDLEHEIDGLVFDPVTFLATAANRSERSEREGVELAAQWRVGERLEVGSRYTYTDSTERDDLGNEVRELRRPRHAGGLSLGYRSSGGLTRAVLTADYGGTRADVFFPPFPAASEIVELEAYWLVDLAVQFALTDAFTLFVRGSNLLDEDYEHVYGYRTPERTGYVGVRASFGR